MPPLKIIGSTFGLPETADAVVIGGGIIGVFTAYYLAKRGMKVALIEKGVIAGEQSSRNWGWCRQQNRDARELPMSTKSLELWQKFTEEEDDSTGFRRCGLLYLSDDEKEIEGWAKWGQFARTVGVQTQLLSSAQAAERGKATGKSWKGGVFSPTDGTADPSHAAPAVARAIIRHGSTVHQFCAARGLETEGGRVSAVVTEKGTIRTKIVVMAGGAWASSFCNQYGIRFPQSTIRQMALAVAPGPSAPLDALHTSSVSLTRRTGGGYTLCISGTGCVDPTAQLLRFSPQFLPMFLKRWRHLRVGNLSGFEAGHESLRRWKLDARTPMELMRVLDPKPDKALVKLTHERAVKMMPALQGRPITDAWAGFIDTTPDGVPGIGEIKSLPGFILAAGFSGHGFGIGPGAGHLIADIASGVAPFVDAAAYDPARFSRSSWGKVAEF